MAAAAQEIGLDADVAQLAYKEGAMAMIDGWIDSIDLEVAHRLPPEKLNAMKIRQRITALLATFKQCSMSTPTCWRKPRECP